jgi:uncharacterized protein YndB with AHSA1/START domain
MPYDPETGRITWRIHLNSSPSTVFEFLATDTGRSRFWAETSREQDGTITFHFPNGMTTVSVTRTTEPPTRFALTYFGSNLEFLLGDDGNGGADLTLTDAAPPDEKRWEIVAGWVSVLLALKAAADFDIDLRNHDPARSWDHGYADN